MQRCFDTLARNGGWLREGDDPDPRGGRLVRCLCCHGSGPDRYQVRHARWCGMPAALERFSAEGIAPADLPVPGGADVVGIFSRRSVRAPGPPAGYDGRISTTLSTHSRESRGMVDALTRSST